MTPRAGVNVLRVVISVVIVYYVLYSSLSIYNTLIAVVLREYDTIFLVGFYYLFFL